MASPRIANRNDRGASFLTTPDASLASLLNKRDRRADSRRSGGYGPLPLIFAFTSMWFDASISNGTADARPVVPEPRPPARPSIGRRRPIAIVWTMPPMEPRRVRCEGPEAGTSGSAMVRRVDLDLVREWVHAQKPSPAVKVSEVSLSSSPRPTTSLIDSPGLISAAASRVELRLFHGLCRRG